MTTATEVKTERGPAADLVDDLISAARDVEWQSHFGADWEKSRTHMLRLRSKVIDALDLWEWDQCIDANRSRWLATGVPRPKVVPDGGSEL